MQPRRTSLTFYQTTIASPSPIRLSDTNAGIFAVTPQANNSFATIATTNTYNNQFQTIFSELNALRQNAHKDLGNLLANDPNATTMRSKGVELAWKYEKAELELGGQGTYKWTPEQKHEIMQQDKVRGAEGHHINNVADNPQHQANPDNIIFAKDRNQHLNEFHNGDFKNSTDGDMIDRNMRMTDANHKRVFKNELTGLGAAIAIGFGVGFTIGFIITLAQSGVSTESLKNAIVMGAKTGAGTAIIGGATHLLARTIGQVSSKALQGILTNAGLEVAENIVKMCNMAVVGTLTIVVFSVYQFVKLIKQGYGTSECLIRIGKQAAFSLTVLAVSIIAHGIWGGYAGIIVSTSIGIIVVTYKIVEIGHTKAISEKIGIYTIKKCCPTF